MFLSNVCFLSSSLSLNPLLSLPYVRLPQSTDRPNNPTAFFFFYLCDFAHRKVYLRRRDSWQHVQSILDSCCGCAAVCRDHSPHERKLLPAVSFFLSGTLPPFPRQYFYPFHLSTKYPPPSCCNPTFPHCSVGHRLEPWLRRFAAPTTTKQKSYSKISYKLSQITSR